jgi:hypothetical protein
MIALGLLVIAIVLMIWKCDPYQALRDREGLD